MDALESRLEDEVDICRTSCFCRLSSCLRCVLIHITFRWIADIINIQEEEGEWRLDVTRQDKHFMEVLEDIRERSEFLKRTVKSN